ncbi:carbonic anhydrase [Streptomyces sp. NBC_00648]|uniref:carbonic anhydrase n=1 Tax=Streptomyces sp. NBC_00648 TaxID=2975797 RepID=UPI0032547F49
METLIRHARAFPARIAGRQGTQETYRRLAARQSPLALFITCSDSRVVPALITGARPGDLFELRTAGHVVPAYDATGPVGAEAATIEYAVRLLGVADIVVCGHSHCGAVGARARGQDLAGAPAVRDWITAQLPDALSSDGTSALADAVQAHVRAQVDRLRAYPCIQERLVRGDLELHAWYYELDTGRTSALCPTGESFLPL